MNRIFKKQKLLIENNLLVQVKVPRGATGNYERVNERSVHFMFPDLPDHTTTCDDVSVSKIKKSVSRF